MVLSRLFNLKYIHYFFPGMKAFLGAGTCTVYQLIFMQPFSCKITYIPFVQCAVLLKILMQRSGFFPPMFCVVKEKGRW